MKTKLLAGATLAICAFSGPSLAQTGLDEATQTGIPSDWQLSGNVGLFSDYRFRGTSYSDKDVALQGGIDLAHSSGFYVGTWGSNLAGYGTYGGSNLEVDLYTGFGGGIGAIGTYDVGVLWYLYPGTDGTDYVELYGSLGFDVAGAQASVGTAWAPDQENVNSNIYLYGDLGYGIPNTPISLSAHLGYSEGSYGFGGAGFNDNYLDWSLGASADVHGLQLGVSYIDTDISAAREVALGVGGAGAPLVADSTIVFSLGYSF